jgi:hypothetical protein
MLARKKHENGTFPSKTTFFLKQNNNNKQNKTNKKPLKRGC